MALPRVEVTVFFEWFVVGDASFHAFSEVSDGRDRSVYHSRGSSNRSEGCRYDGFDTPGPECIFGEVKPVDSRRGWSLTEPRNKGAKFLELNKISPL